MQPPHGLHGSGHYQPLGIQHGTRPILGSEVLIHYNLDPTIFSTPAAPLGHWSLLQTLRQGPQGQSDTLSDDVTLILVADTLKSSTSILKITMSPWSLYLLLWQGPQGPSDTLNKIFLSSVLLFQTPQPSNASKNAKSQVRSEPPAKRKKLEEELDEEISEEEFDVRIIFIIHFTVIMMSVFTFIVFKTILLWKRVNQQTP